MYSTVCPLPNALCRVKSSIHSVWLYHVMRLYPFFSFLISSHLNSSSSFPTIIMLHTAVRASVRPWRACIRPQRSFVSTVLLSKTYDDKTVADLRADLRARGLSVYVSFFLESLSLTLISSHYWQVWLQSNSYHAYSTGRCSFGFGSSLHTCTHAESLADAQRCRFFRFPCRSCPERYFSLSCASCLF